MSMSCLLCQSTLVKKREITAKRLHRLCCEIRYWINDIDSCISPALFIISISSCTILVSTSCMIAINYHCDAKVLYMAIPLSINLIKIILLCYVCEMVPKKFAEVCDSIELHLNTTDGLIDEKHTLQLLIAMKGDIVFTGYRLFTVRSTTILHMLSFIISYSVILVQTDVISKDSHDKMSLNCSSNFSSVQ